MERVRNEETERRKLMALRTLVLSKNLRDKKKALEEARAKMTALETREAEIAKAIEEASSDEERAAVDEEISNYEADKEAAEKEAADLEEEVRSLEDELAKVETEKPEEPEKKEERREEKKIMKKRWKDMNHEERTSFTQREDVQAFLGEVRTAIKEKRAITGAGNLIPTVMIGLIKENIEEYSKLYSRVYMRPIAGTGRVVVEGAIPEAVWTEACANLNELDLGFSPVEVDGYKVGGYFRICNATLEDSDIDLASELMLALGQAIGFALDKAILFGTGTKMPVGIVTALKAVSGTPNVVSHAASVTDKALIKALIGDLSLAKGKYSRGVITWTMNRSTYNKLLAQFVEVDASGAYVSVMNGVMPVVGGDIVVLDFIPDDVIVAGYFDLYLLAERAGTSIGTSEHAFWIADMTGFKGTARYDGKVLINNAFVAIGINGKGANDMTVTFAQDTANTAANPEG